MWDILLRRNLFDSKTDDFSDLMRSISSYMIRTSIEDNLVWWPDTTGVFSVKSYYSWNYMNSGSATINLKIWSSRAPPREICFLWTADLGKIFTQDNM